MAPKKRKAKPMSLISFPTNFNSVLVADASVVINLNATGSALEIIRAQAGSLVVTSHAFDELKRGARNGHKDAEQLQALIDLGIVSVGYLGETGTRIYASLVEGSAVQTLDDGEAATIGYAVEAAGIALIDERKARNICASTFPELPAMCTADLLLCKAVERALGQMRQIDAVTNALRGARMRVPPDRIRAVVDLIGEEVAASCNSLPKLVRE